MIINTGFQSVPLKNFNALKLTYISLNKLGFEDLNIYRE